MKIFIWVLQVLVVLAFLAAGFGKLTMSVDDMLTQMPWTEDFVEWQIRLIGGLELLGAIGVIVPMFVKQFGKLVPIASICLGVTMIGAAITHFGREESIIVPAILGLISFGVAFLRRDMLK
ncbi:MAG: DoxX family protein [Cyclobacteriaceae bacterium]